MEALLAVGGIYILVVVVVWLIIFIGAIAAMVAASRSGDALRRVKKLEVDLARLETLLRADPGTQVAAADGRGPAPTRPLPGETPWDAAQRMSRERDANSWWCRRCGKQNAEAILRCECGHEPSALEKLESRGEVPPAAILSTHELQARTAMGLRAEAGDQGTKTK